MTFDQLYKLFQTFVDKAGSSYFPRTQFDQLASAVYNIYVESELDRMEENEEFTSRISYLYRNIQVLNTDTVIESVDCPNFRKRIRINGKFRKDCNGTITYPVVAIFRARNNEIDLMQNDPFNKGDDNEPTFIVTSDSQNRIIWKVFSATTPLEINVTYCKENQTINSATAPNTVFEAPNDVAEQICSFIAVQGDNIIENFNRSQIQQQFLSRFTSVPKPQQA